MERPRQDSRGDRLGQEDNEVRAATRFAVVTTAIGVAFVVVAALWVSSCGEPTAVDTAACGRPQRMLLASAAPLVFCCGGLWAFVRTYRVWRSRGTWWGWQGAGWFLLTMMLLTLTMGGPPIMGAVPGS
ncbi:MAG TPA: hypothetical protein VFQ37_13955 [Mycobacterium sp.]|nr:hypothetical protein [Mycobacterium sp.]